MMIHHSRALPVLFLAFAFVSPATSSADPPECAADIDCPSYVNEYDVEAAQWCHAGACVPVAYEGDPCPVEYSRGSARPCGGEGGWLRCFACDPSLDDTYCGGERHPLCWPIGDVCDAMSCGPDPGERASLACESEAAPCPGPVFPEW